MTDKTFRGKTLAALMLGGCVAGAWAQSQGERQPPANTTAMLATLSDAIAQAWRERPEIAQAHAAVASADMTYRAKQAGLWMPRLDASVQSGLYRTPIYTSQPNGLPSDVTATEDGKPVPLQTLLDYLYGARIAPPSLVLYRTGVPTTLDEARASMLSPSQRESRTVSSYSSGYQVNAALSLSYNLYSGGSDRRAIENARLQRTQADLNVLTAKRKVALEVIDAYINVHLAWLQKNHDEAALKTWHRKREATARGVQLGTGSRQADDLAELGLQLRQIKVERSAAQLQEKFESYCMILRVTPCTVPAQWPVHGDVALPEALSELAARWKTAQGDEQEVNKAQQRLAVADARSIYLPRANIYLSSSMGGSSMTGFSDAFDQFKYRGWNVGIGLSWNLFDGFQSSTTVATAMQRQRTADLEAGQRLAAACQEQAQAVRARHAVDLASREARINLDLASIKRRDLQIRQGHGLVSDSQVLDAELDMLSARLTSDQQDWERRRREWLHALSPCPVI